MKVEMLHVSPLSTIVEAIRICYDSLDKSDSFYPDVNPYPYFSLGNKDKKLILDCISKGHHVPLEMIDFTFKVEGLSRACMLELEKHRLTSICAKSSRYTLKKDLKNEKSFLNYHQTDFTTCDFERASKYIVLTGEQGIDSFNVKSLDNIRMLVQQQDYSNDKLKYSLPDAYRIDFVMKLNCRSWRNMVSLRSDKAALWEFRDFIYETDKVIPEQYKFLYQDCMKGC